MIFWNNFRLHYVMRFFERICNKIYLNFTASKPLFQKLGSFFQGFQEELDAFADDAMGRRFGNGAKFYGKRKSKFYGEEDEYKKRNKYVSDPTEDYQGPTGSGYFVWQRNEDG